jgi:hypothetical protein
MDIHDARVEALKVGIELGLDVEGFNRIWRIIVPAALAHPQPHEGEEADRG